MKVRFKIFSGIESWESLSQKAADFATQIGRENLINITNSEGIITVWYWG